MAKAIQQEVTVGYEEVRLVKVVKRLHTAYEESVAFETASKSTIRL